MIIYYFFNFLLNFYFILIKKDPESSFSRYLDFIKNENKYQNIIKNYEEKKKVNMKQLIELTDKSYIGKVPVKRRTDLANSYLNEFFTCEQVEAPNGLFIISKNQSVHLMCDDEYVGSVIRDIAKKNVAKHFGNKIKLTIKDHYEIKRELKTHESSGIMAAHCFHADFLNPNELVKYSNKKKLSSDEQKIANEDGDSIGRWIYANAYEYLPWTMNSYEEFKKRLI